MHSDSASENPKHRAYMIKKTQKGKKIMKTRFSKLLSVLLCLSMLLTTFGFTVIAEGEAVTEYYVKFGGSGDGRSATAPAGSIATLSQTSTPTVMPQAIP